MTAPASTRFPIWDWFPDRLGVKVTPVTATTDGAVSGLSGVETADGRVLCVWSEAGSVAARRNLWMGYASSSKALTSGDGSVPIEGRTKLAYTSEGHQNLGLTASLATGPDGVIYLQVAPVESWSNITWSGLPNPGLSGDIGTVLFSTSDGGVSWRYVGRFSTSHPPTAAIFGKWFAGGEIVDRGGELLAVTQSYGNYAGAIVLGYAIETSSDGGATWTNRYNSTGVYSDGGSRNLGWLNSRYYTWVATNSTSTTGQIWYSSSDGVTWTAFDLEQDAAFDLWGVDSATLGALRTTTVRRVYSATVTDPDWPSQWSDGGVVLPTEPPAGYLVWLNRYVVLWSGSNYLIWWPGPGTFPWWPLYEWPEMIEAWPNWTQIGALADERDRDLETHLAHIPNRANPTLLNWRFPYSWADIAPLMHTDRRQAAVLADENMQSLEDLLEQRSFSGGPDIARRWNPNSRWPQLIDRLCSDNPASRREAAGLLYENDHQLVDLFATRRWA